MTNEESEVEDAALNTLVVLFYLPVALGSLVYLFWSGGEYRLLIRTVGEHPARDVGLGVLAGLVVVLASRLAARLPAGRRMVAVFAQAIGRPTLVACVVLAFAAAIGEELLFRAVLQPDLGIWLVTMLFAAAHFPYDRDLALWPLLAFPTGLLFGALFDLTGAALAPIVAHGVVNTLNLRWIARRA